MTTPSAPRPRPLFSNPRPIVFLFLGLGLGFALACFVCLFVFVPSPGTDVDGTRSLIGRWRLPAAANRRPRSSRRRRSRMRWSVSVVCFFLATPLFRFRFRYRCVVSTPRPLLPRPPARLCWIRPNQKLFLSFFLILHRISQPFRSHQSYQLPDWSDQTHTHTHVSFSNRFPSKFFGSRFLFFFSFTS